MTVAWWGCELKEDDMNKGTGPCFHGHNLVNGVVLSLNLLGE